ncbi:DUF3307 domain-containing protein [Nonlabens ponticola]|uniref:DUF3307 domain-containing protein n=1 Tax=Nonlabens ponticola TaxID=2496866 RepID=A0A3S9N1E9_9FLAO|nr:DUF3307 domain-containing protein [Nonlabens ponticola]
MAVLIKLIIAHLIGDFFLQTDKSVQKKEAEKLKSVSLYIHVLLHGLLSWIALWNIELWYIALFIMLSHLVVDVAKLYLTNKKNKRWLFLLDQVAHIATLVIAWLWLSNFNIVMPSLSSMHFWAFIAGMLFLTAPVSIALKTFFTRWKLDPRKVGVDSLKNAGKWIGMIERLLVFVFIVAGHFEAVGFLLAAKSVFRFGDLNRESNMKLTEYVLIGTLLSFGIAILTGLAYQSLL